MATGQLNDFLRRLRTALLRPEAGGAPDAHLLEAFITQHDEAAFAALVQRHGPMVWGVCRRVLGQVQDAEDAFQATFLVLVRKAAAVVPRALVGNWLYGVAWRTAQKARVAAAKRRLKEKQVPVLPEPPARAAPECGLDWRPLLDEALERLPGPYRAAVVLCDLEGMTHQQAARQLGWPVGTLSTRLVRARALLARRLARQGVALASGSLAAVLSQGTVAAGVPPPVVSATVETARRLAAGQASAGLIPAQVAALAEGGWTSMGTTPVKMAALIVALTVALASGLGLLRWGPGAAAQEQARAAVVPAPAGSGPAAQADPATPKEPKAQEEPPADKAKLSVQSLPPVVVRTVPRSGDKQVDAAKVKEIRVTFSKRMRDQSWSWSGISDDTFPKATGKIRYDADRMTCTLPVRLAPGKTYAIWLNSEKHHNFKDADGQPAVPYLLVFETKP
jgi:RNA polymerase sigma-70 factor (ECF subfamily)